MAKDTLKSTGEDQMRDGSVTGSAAKGYLENAADGSSYNKYGNRADYNKLANHLFR